MAKNGTQILQKWRKAVAYGFLIAGWFLIGWFSRGWLLPTANPDLALVGQANALVSEKYYGDLPPARQRAYSAIRGLLSSLGDPYAVFNEPSHAEYTMEGLRGNGGVIGLKGEMRSGRFVVLQVASGGPAEKAGLQPDDILLQIDDWPVRPDADYMEVMTMIRGPVDTQAQLIVQRGDQTLTFEVPREPVQEVTAQTLAGGIAYLRFDQFTAQTPPAVETALQDLLSAAPPGLIIDLRYNGGGLIDATHTILDLFLDEGLAFYAQNGNGELLPYPTLTGGPAEDIPLVILISSFTYSAPEIMAASLADRQRGTLIGETTHGKGAIRETLPLFDGSSIQLTVAQWLSPVHQTLYEGQGVPPDIFLEQAPDAAGDDVLEYAIQHLLSGR